MLFNSIAFAAFFSTFFVLYWGAIARHLRLQNLAVLIGSYAFYAWGDWRFLPLLIGHSGAFYLLGIALHSTTRVNARRLALLAGLALGLGGLAVFKYYIPFVHSSPAAVPLGISFYTFRNLSYLIDIYRRKLEPTRDWIAYFAYIAFFPSLLAGPIDRPQGFLPQLQQARTFDYDGACDGMRYVAWGLFKKIVVADNCGVFADQIFAGYATLPASSLLLGAFFYTIQIYADFSGYSEMALGLGRLLGFRITRNFDAPFFARNIAEFWRRWHISLTSWVTEYVFTPLAIRLRDLGKLGVTLAILMNFTLIGLWHGPKWNYVLFGLIHGCFFIPLITRGTVNKKRAVATDRWIPAAREAASMLLTFGVVMLSFVVFRSATPGDAAAYLRGLISPTLFSVPVVFGRILAVGTLLVSLMVLVVEWSYRDAPHPLTQFGLTWPRPLRWGFYYAAVLLMFFCAGNGQNFIYIQF